MNGWMTEWMDEWATSLLSYLFTERPIRWGTSSLSYYFSEQPLICATSPLTLLLSSLPASFSVASATQVFSSRSCYNAFSNLQQQSRLPGASQHHWIFAARSRANAYCHGQLQTRVAGALHQIDKQLRSVNSVDFLGLLRSPHFFYDLFSEAELSLQSRAHFSNLVFQKYFEPDVFFNMLNCKSSSRYNLVHFLSTTFPDRGLEPRKQRPYFGDPRSHMTPKNRVSRPRVFSPVNSHVSELLHFPTTWWWVVDMMMWLTWWRGWHDGVNANHDHRPKPGSFLTKLPLITTLPLLIYLSDPTSQESKLPCQMWWSERYPASVFHRPTSQVHTLKVV